MYIQAIGRCCPKPHFAANEGKSNYENPVSRGTEKGLTVLESLCNCCRHFNLFYQRNCKASLWKGRSYWVGCNGVYNAVNATS